MDAIDRRAGTWLPPGWGAAMGRAGVSGGGAAALLAAVEGAAAAIARLDQALDGHPLLAAFLYRARLEAVRRQAAVDGHAIDPWHLAAVLEGLRLRMPTDPPRIVDRSEVFEAARTALGLHQWLIEPDGAQEEAVLAASRHLEAAAGLAGIGESCWSWLDEGGARAPLRAALVRQWTGRGLLRAAAPLTGVGALSAEAPLGRREGTIAFLEAFRAEAVEALALLRGLETGWRSARARAGGRRRTSRACLAVDVMAATPLISATTLGRAIGMSVKCAGELLERLVAERVAVEVTHRCARRLFGLAGLAPLREATVGPRRPVPGRGRGRPRLAWPAAVEAEDAVVAPAARFERPPIDYGALEAAMAHCEVVIRESRRRLQAQGGG